MVGDVIKARRVVIRWNRRGGEDKKRGGCGFLDSDGDRGSGMEIELRAVSSAGGQWLALDVRHVGLGTEDGAGAVVSGSMWKPSGRDSRRRLAAGGYLTRGSH